MIFIDLETNNLVAESTIKAEFDLLKSRNPQEYNYSFEEYLNNACGKNGFLKPLKRRTI